MKKTTKSNPLKFFNDAKEARNKSFSKSLIKAQDGIEMNGDPEDMMINKPGYGAKKNVYTRPEPTPATKNTVYQGPISEEGTGLISRAEDNKQKYPLSVPKEINDIAQSDRNPKNSKRIEKGKPYVKLSKDMGKAYRKDFKNLPKNSPEKKERRANAIIATVAEAVAAPFMGKFVAKHWNLPKKNGGVVKSKKK